MESNSATEHTKSLFTFDLICTICLVLLSAAVGLFLPGIYESFIPPVHLEESRGQDLISIVAAVPVLILGTVLLAHGKPEGRILKAGSFAYFLYIYLLYAMGGVYNILIPIYIAICAFSLFGLIRQFDDYKKIVCSCENPKDLASAIFFLAASLVLSLLWGSIIFSSVVESRSPDANVVICIDFIVVIPSYIATAFGLIKGKDTACFAADVLLTFSALLGFSIVSGQLAVIIFYGPVSAGPLVFFSIFTLAALVLEIRRFRNAMGLDITGKKA